MSDQFLEIENLNVSYGQSLILRDVCMTAKPGTITAIMGSNGVGKTTLLKAIMGLLELDSGSISLCGEDVTKSPTYTRTKKGLGYVPQGREIFPKLTVDENLIMGLEANQKKIKKIPNTLVYDLFPVLAKMGNRLGGNLSGGQQQQLAISRALVGYPKVLLLDEPTEGIQPSIIQDIEKVLIKLKNQGDMAIILVEQYLEFAQRLADQYYIIDRGSVVAEGEMDKLSKEDVTSYLTF